MNRPHESIFTGGDDVPQEQFAETRWTLVRRTLSEDDSEAKAALSALCERYWYPLYAFLRRSGNTPEDAQDHVQGFFEKIIVRGDLGRADQAKGKLRSYLIGGLKHFVSNEWTRANAQKRGGGQTLISLDQDWAEGQYRIEPEDLTDPEKLYERRWAMILLTSVLARLREEFEGKGKGRDFAVLEPFLTMGSDPDYAEVGETLGVTVGNAKVVVHRMRKRYRELIRREIADTVSHPDEIEEELQHLFKVLSGQSE